MIYKPILRRWEFIFDDMLDLKSRAATGKKIAEIIWNNPELYKIDIPGRCRMKGMIYGTERYVDGTGITTNLIESIERVESHLKNDIMCVITKSGSRYYFETDDYKAYALFMFSDYINTI